RGRGEEGGPLGGAGVGGLLGHVVAGGEGAATQVGRPGSPDAEDVAVQVGQVVAGGPQDQGGAGDLAAGAPVLVVVAAVGTEAGPVVLHHGVDGGRVVDGPPGVGVGLLPPGLGPEGVPAPRGGAHPPLGPLGRLAVEDPVPPAGGEAGVAAGQRLP